MVQVQTKVQRSRVLLADDNQIILNTVAVIFAPEFDVVGAMHDGWTFLEAADRLDPDVVVLEISMPVLAGVEVAQRPMQLPRGRHGISNSP